MNKSLENCDKGSTSPDPDVSFTFELSPLPIWISSIPGDTFLKVNQAAIDYYGYSESEFLQLTREDITVKPTGDSPFGFDDFPLPEKRQADEGLEKHQKKNGQLVDVQLTRREIEWQGKAATLVIAIDRTAEAYRENQVKRRQELLAATLNVKEELLKVDDWLKALERIFKVAGPILDVDRVYYFGNTNVGDREYTSQKVEWSSEGVAPQIDNPGLQDVPVEEFSLIMASLRQGKAFSAIVPEMSDSDFKTLMQAQDILSFLVLPIIIDEQLYGFIGFDNCREEHQWDSLELEFLKSMRMNIEVALERQQVIIQLQASEKRFKALVQEGSDMIAILDPEGNYKYVSPTTKRILGTEPEYYLGKNGLDFIHPDDRPYILSMLEEMANSRHLQLKPYRFKDANHNWHWLETTLTNLMSDPNIEGIVANTSDITDELIKSERLKLADERYRLVSEASQDHIYDLDLSTNEVKRSGHSLQKLFGYNSPQEEVENNAFWMKNIHPEDRERAYETLKEAAEDPAEDKCIQQYRFKKADGSFANIMDTGYIIRNKEGKANRLIGAVRDISEIVRKKDEEQLLLEISGAIGEAKNLEEGLNTAISKILSFTNLTSGEVWLTSIDEQRLNLIAMNSNADKGGSFFRHKSTINTLEKGEGLAGIAWQESRSIIWKDLSEYAEHLASGGRSKLEQASGLSVPIIQNGDFLGTFLFFSGEGEEILHRVQKLLTSVGDRIGSSLKHRIAEEQLHNFFSISPDFLAIIGFDGYFRKANEAFTHVFGYSEQELMTAPVRTYLHPRDKGEAIEQIKNINENNPEGTIPLTLLTREGKTVWAIFYFRYNKKERLIYTVGKDVTDQKEVELDLRDAYERLNHAQKIGKLGYWKADLKADGPHWWSQQAYNIYGYSPDEFTPTFPNVMNSFHPEDRHLLEQDPAGIPEGVEVEFENRIISKSGETRWVSQRMKLKRDPDGNPAVLEGTFQDITERKEFEHQLKLSNERFELAMKATNEIIWDWDHQTDEVTRGTGHGQEFDYATVENSSRENSWFHMIHPDDKDDVWNSVQHTLWETTENYWQKEYRLQKKNGDIVYLVDRGYIIRDEKEKPVRSVGSALDNTASRKYLEEIKRQNKTLKEIAWKQSHVVRAPLARIMGLVDLMPRHIDNHEKLKQILTYTRNSTDELDKVIREISEQTESVNIEHEKSSPAD